MKHLINHWQRKAMSIVLAIIVWFFVDQSLTTTKTIDNIAVRISQLPPGLTLEGGNHNGLLNRRISLNLTGNKTFLEELSANDFEVQIEAPLNEVEWLPKITKKNLTPVKPGLDLNKAIAKVNSKNFVVKLTKLMKEKIPIIITKPIGEPPKGYQYVDVWPYQLSATIWGPEEVVKYYKTNGVKKTFNLSEISKEQLDTLLSTSKENGNDEVSFFIPDSWKKIEIPSLSEFPFIIDDDESKNLRIAFIRSDLYSINASIPVSLFYPEQHLDTLNPQTLHLLPGKLLRLSGGVLFVEKTLFAKNVSKQFLDTVRNMLQITIIAAPKSETTHLLWSLQLINPRLLEDRYVAIRMADISSEERVGKPKLREEFLRNLFRNYANRLQLYSSEKSPFLFQAEIQDGKVILTENKR